MIDWYKLIKDNFDAGNYTVTPVDQVAVFVVKGKITAAQYKEITAQDYEPV